MEVEEDKTSDNKYQYTITGCSCDIRNNQVRGTTESVISRAEGRDRYTERVSYLLVDYE